MPVTGQSRARRGFTLVELLITLAILGIVGAMIAQLMMKQQRFFQRMSDQTTVRRELRTALGTLPSELRAVSSVGGDIAAFGTTSITFRATLGTSFVCEKASSTELLLPPVNSARTITTNWVTPPGVGDTVFALRHDSAGVSGDYWSAHRITAVTQGAGLCVTSPYLDPVLDAGKPRFRVTVTPAVPDSVVRGSALRFTRAARYELARMTSGRWYLQRQELQSGTWTTPVTVSGPYMAPGTGRSGGLSFSYVDSLGSAVALGGVSTRIARIDIALRAQGMAPATPGNPVVVDSVLLSVAVRNRR